MVVSSSELIFKELFLQRLLAIHLEQQLAQLSGAEIPPSAKVLISKVQAILRGDRNAALADDPNLDFDDAVELHLLLEGLGAK